MDIKLRFGNRLRELRQQQSLSQEKLAFLCGLHRTYISDVEIGKRNISIENIERLSKALAVSLQEFFSFDPSA